MPPPRQNDEERGGVGKVAIVDDDIGVLDSLKFLLEVAGHQVATYSSPAAYLSSDDSDADCVIVDQHMPQMTGLELVARLGHDVPRDNIMLITGSLSRAIVQQAASLGIAIVVEKPPADGELLNFVSRCTRD